jgi:NADH-quinone oxidoreductase subunit B
MQREDAPVFLETQGSNGLEKLSLTTKASTFLEKFNNWVSANSSVPFVFDTACCTVEYSWKYKFKYFEEDFTPEQLCAENSDLLFIGGTITRKTLPLLLETYEKMPQSKWVVAIGACPLSGGPFDSYNVVKDISKYIPVDIFIPGCPPRPEDIEQGMKLLEERIRFGVRACDKL